MHLQLTATRCHNSNVLTRAFWAVIYSYLRLESDNNFSTYQLKTIQFYAIYPTMQF